MEILYTDGVFQKFKVGVQVVEIVDPQNAGAVACELHELPVVDGVADRHAVDEESGALEGGRHGRHAVVRLPVCEHEDDLRDVRVVAEHGANMRQGLAQARVTVELGVPALQVAQEAVLVGAQGVPEADLRLGAVAEAGVADLHRVERRLLHHAAGEVAHVLPVLAADGGDAPGIGVLRDAGRGVEDEHRLHQASLAQVVAVGQARVDALAALAVGVHPDQVRDVVAHVAAGEVVPGDVLALRELAVAADAAPGVVEPGAPVADEDVVHHTASVVADAVGQRSVDASARLAAAGPSVPMLQDLVVDVALVVQADAVLELAVDAHARLHVVGVGLAVRDLLAVDDTRLVQPHALLELPVDACAGAGVVGEGSAVCNGGCAVDGAVQVLALAVRQDAVLADARLDAVVKGGQMGHCLAAHVAVVVERDAVGEDAVAAGAGAHGVLKDVAVRHALAAHAARVVQAHAVDEAAVSAEAALGAVGEDGAVLDVEPAGGAAVVKALAVRQLAVLAEAGADAVREGGAVRDARALDNAVLGQLPAGQQPVVT
mmetsp:Transcript_20355/g.51237  ORF Transcript_20355/g.51237 Transcript_20355/m.51237 type:complete len:545 (+) Transcript_20355:193-1827(+)